MSKRRHRTLHEGRRDRVVMDEAVEDKKGHSPQPARYLTLRMPKPRARFARNLREREVSQALWQMRGGVRSPYHYSQFASILDDALDVAHDLILILNFDFILGIRFNFYD